MSADKIVSIQNDFFQRARRDGGPVTIFLTNGKKLTGRLRSFDKFTVIVESNRIEQMIFKHAISTISLGRAAGPPRPRRPDEPPSAPAESEPDEQAGE